MKNGPFTQLFSIPQLQPSALLFSKIFNLPQLDNILKSFIPQLWEKLFDYLYEKGLHNFFVYTKRHTGNICKYPYMPEFRQVTEFRQRKVMHCYKISLVI